MKYLKLLLIPLITFMFMVPTKADNTPDWVYTEHYYVVSEYLPTGSLTVHVLSTKNNIVTYPGQTRLFVPITSVLEVYVLRSGSDTWESIPANHTTLEINGINHTVIRPATKDATLRYSNFDVFVDGELVFPKTPVTTPAMVRQKATEKAVGTLAMEVQGTSLTISAVGGVILGAVFLMLLVDRLLRWGTRSVR